MKKLEDLKKEIEKEFGVGKENIKKEDIKLTKEESKEEEKPSNIVIPGLTDKKPDVPKKKPMIMEMK